MSHTHQNGCPVFTMDQEPEVAAVLEQRAEFLGAEFLAVVPHPDAYPRPWSTSPIIILACVRFMFPLATCLGLSLAGRHQDWNASLAVQVCREWLKQQRELKKKPTMAIAEKCKQRSNGHDQPQLPRMSSKTGGR